MIFKIKHRIPPLVILFFCFYVNAVYAQIDSVKLLKEKINNYSQIKGVSKQDTVYINLLNDLSYRLRYSELDSMELLATQALELSTTVNYKKGELEALTNFSALHLYNGNTEKVLEYGEEVLGAKEISEFPQMQMKIYNQMGQAYFIRQDYPLAYTFFLRALELGEKHNDEAYKFKMNMNLGTMFNLLEDYDEALLFYSASEESLGKLNDDKMEAMVSSNLGFLYTQQGDVEKARVLLLKSIGIFKSQKVMEWLAYSYTTFGQLNLKMNKYKEALANYHKALDIHASLNDIKGRADIHYGLGKANFGLGNIQISEEFILQSLSLYKTFDLNTGLERCYRTLYEIKKKQDLTIEALKYLELTEKLANDISKEKNRRNLNMLNAKLNFEKERENLKTANELTINKQKKYVQWALIALAILGVFAVLILRANTREKRLNKNLEIQALVLNENQKKLQNINTNQDRLFSIVGHDLRSPIITLKSLLDLYLEDPDGKDYFEKFAPKLREDLEQLQFTMDNLLHWGKTQMKGYSAKVEKITVSKELDKILQFFRKEIEKKSLTVENLMTENFYVLADLDQFNVIFRNLISNAIKFTPKKGKITISSKKQDSNLFIKISDTGVGMSSEIVEKLFKNTEHFTTFGTNLEKGTGLGLRLAKEMALINNGDIHVTSQPGVGTDFSVELPIASS